jgi:hypothetical protein
LAHLKDLFQEKRSAAVDDCVHLIDGEVSDKGGLSGMAIKAAYAMVKGIKPTFVRESVDHLLDEFAGQLDPIYQDAKTQGKGIPAHFEANKGKVADALLSITDRRAKNSKHGTAVKAYEKLRGNAKSQVEAAVPRLARLVEKYDRLESRTPWLDSTAGPRGSTARSRSSPGSIGSPRARVCTARGARSCSARRRSTRPYHRSWKDRERAG